VHFQSKYNTTYTTNFVGINLIENSSSSYRCGFQGYSLSRFFFGKKDDEVKGEGNSVNSNLPSSQHVNKNREAAVEISIEYQLFKKGGINNKNLAKTAMENNAKDPK
jgi:hypothetical protein